jgi:prepilin peptidase CpaA
MSLDNAILASFVVLFTLAAALIDLRSKRLPNALTVPVLAAGILFHVITGAADRGLQGAGYGLLVSLGGFAIGFGLLFVMWLIGSGGGGDVKYMGALGAWLGPTYIFYVFLFGTIVTAIASVGVLIFEAMRLGFGRAQARYLTAGVTKVKGSAERVERARQEALTRRRLMPWAVPAGIATWMVLAYIILRHQ